MPVTSLPVANHRWTPTPLCGRGGTPDGNFTYLCSKCRAKVTKAELIDDAVPDSCTRRTFARSTSGSTENAA